MTDFKPGDRVIGVADFGRPLRGLKGTVARMNSKTEVCVNWDIQFQGHDMGAGLPGYTDHNSWNVLVSHIQLAVSKRPKRYVTGTKESRNVYAYTTDDALLEVVGEFGDNLTVRIVKHRQRGLVDNTLYSVQKQYFRTVKKGAFNVKKEPSKGQSPKLASSRRSA